jgi:hypothetical protein
MLETLADCMTKAGLAKLKAGQRKYEGWHVSRRDVERWIGTWMYFLAFPRLSDGMFHKKQKADAGEASEAAGSSTRAGGKRKASQ